MAIRRFDDYLYRLRADELKPMARIWGLGGQTRKDQCIETICDVLATPKKIKRVVAQLSPFEHTALAILKEMGGEADIEALALALRISGVKVKPPKYRAFRPDPVTSLVKPLIQRGLVLNKHGSNIFSSHIYTSSPPIVFSDDRLLAAIEPKTLPPYPISRLDSPTRTTARRPTAVLLDIMGLLQAIDQLGGLPLTKSRSVRKNTLKKLMRSLGWEMEALSIDGLLLPRPDEAFPTTLLRAGLLAQKNGVLELAISLDAFAKKTIVEQIRPLIEGFVHNHNWQEMEKQTWSETGELYAKGRAALIWAVRRVPQEPDGFFSIDAFSDAIFASIGSDFSLHQRLVRPSVIWNPSQKGAEKVEDIWNPPQKDVEEAEERWLETRRKAWQKLERPWIAAVFRTWWYYLGLVELGWTGNEEVPTLFRLTELGSTVFFGESAAKIEVADEQSAKPWLIQPNFELVVYLDRISPTQLAFLERHTQRQEIQQHIAHYRLTRESVYLALENGSTLKHLLAELQSGAAVEIPQNVETEIRQWAELREQLVLHKSPRILEFVSDSSRQKAIEEGIKGTPLGLRFLLLAPQQPETLSCQKRFDYAQTLPKCLSVTETGQIVLTESDIDLLVEPMLDRWAQRSPDSSWQLTRSSVGTAIEANHPAEELFEFLSARLTHEIPLLLNLALRTWSGGLFNADMEAVTLFYSPIPSVVEAIAYSQTLKPFIRGRLGANLLMVEMDKVEDFIAQLKWIGLELHDELRFLDDGH